MERIHIHTWFHSQFQEFPEGSGRKCHNLEKGSLHLSAILAIIEGICRQERRPDYGTMDYEHGRGTACFDALL